jgi:iron complex transport system substrate-binding protein
MTSSKQESEETAAAAAAASKLKSPERVISLLGAATETIYRLGLSHILVARSHECDYPPDVLSLPCISRPRLDVNASSLDIDTAVRSKAAAGEPIYKLDEEVLGKEVGNFDLWIAQDHCRVCAITPKDLQQSKHIAAQSQSQVKKLQNDQYGEEEDKPQQCTLDMSMRQLILKPSTLEDCLNDVIKIANALNVPERGIALKQTLKQQLDRVTHLVKSRTISDAKARPRVALLEWCDPIMGCGYWIPELVELAGGQALHCPPLGSGGATPTISFETLIDSKPDVIIFALCGFGLTRAAKEIKNSTMFCSGSSCKNGMDRMTRLKEACNDRVYVIDGNYLVNRSGPRVVESCEALCEAIHPEWRGHFGHFGTELLTTYDKAVKMTEQGLVTGSKKVRPQPFPEGDESKRNNGGDCTSARSGNETEDELQQPPPIRSITTIESPGEVVTKQVKYLESGNIESAFALNSNANQERWCGAQRFGAVLRSNDDFKRLLEESASIGRAEEKEDVATVRVSIPEKGERRAVKLIWTMVAELQRDNGSVAWRTEKVGMAH